MSDLHTVAEPAATSVTGDAATAETGSSPARTRLREKKLKTHEYDTPTGHSWAMTCEGCSATGRQASCLSVTGCRIIDMVCDKCPGEWQLRVSDD